MSPYQVLLLWQEPEQETLVPRVTVMVTALPPYVPLNARSFVPFTWRAGPTMAAVVVEPVATPLWQVAQVTPEKPMCFECWPVLVVGMLWQEVQVMAAPVQRGIAVVFPPVKLPWQ